MPCCSVDTADREIVGQPFPDPVDDLMCQRFITLTRQWWQDDDAGSVSC